MSVSCVSWFRLCSNSVFVHTVTADVSLQDSVALTSSCHFLSVLSQLAHSPPQTRVIPCSQPLLQACLQRSSNLCSSKVGAIELLLVTKTLKLSCLRPSALWTVCQLSQGAAELTWGPRGRRLRPGLAQPAALTFPSARWEVSPGVLQAQPVVVLPPTLRGVGPESVS